MSKNIIIWFVTYVIAFGVSMLALYWFLSPAPAPEPALETESTPVTNQDPWQSSVYVHAVDWPPQVQVVEEAFSCTEAGAEIERAGKTELRTIDNTPYCVTTTSEGAAGSTYTQYAYTLETAPTETTFLTFSVRRPQCGNYDEPEQTACTAEQTAFNPDQLVHDWVAENL